MTRLLEPLPACLFERKCILFVTYIQCRELIVAGVEISEGAIVCCPIGSL